MADESEISAKEALIGIDASLARIADALEVFSSILEETLGEDGVIGVTEGWSGKSFKYIRTLKVD